jgi:pimeloyl-ACP methyl ester carboxylesterase
MNWKSVTVFGAVLFSCALSPQEPTTEAPETGVVDSSCGLWTIEPECSDGTYLPINGISLYYEEHGQGEPLLLLHGGAGSAENFNLMLPGLAKHYRVITPDSRAQGRSTDDDKPLSYLQMVDDMIALLDALDIGSAYVGGWSDGAAIALHMAIYHPKRVRALLLTPVDLTSDGLSDLFWEETKEMEFPEKLETWWRERLRPTEEDMSGINVPTLFVIGENEQYVKLDHVSWQYKLIPGAEVAWIPDADHILPAYPDAVNGAFLSFLKQQH